MRSILFWKISFEKIPSFNLIQEEIEKYIPNLELEEDTNTKSLILRGKYPEKYKNKVIEILSNI